jgi:hypothetical protein
MAIMVQERLLPSYRYCPYCGKVGDSDGTRQIGALTRTYYCCRKNKLHRWWLDSRTVIVSLGYKQRGPIQTNGDGKP